MQTCVLCNQLSPDNVSRCTNCGADLSLDSATARALKDLQNNPRVKSIRIIVSDDACPACRKAEGEFLKDDVPALPVHGCSHANGCRCFYEPKLLEVFP